MLDGVVLDDTFAKKWPAYAARAQKVVLRIDDDERSLRAFQPEVGLRQGRIGGIGIRPGAGLPCWDQAPQSIGLTSPRDATGLFELTPTQVELLAPFEGMGADATWQFELPRASNRFDFTSVADVLVTFDYTAFSNDLYRAQVVRTMSPWLSADRPFSFRQDLPDLWYELRNPGESPTPLKVTFDTRRADFPPSLDSLAVEALTMYFSRADGETFEVDVKSLTFAHGVEPPVGGGAASINGVINSRRGNGSAWIPIVGKEPLGVWELAFDDTPQLRERFKSGSIKDVLFVVTYRARTPAWPGVPE